MGTQQNQPVNTDRIKRLLNRQKGKMKLQLSHCAHCSLCAESCFLFMANDKEPEYMPSYKVIYSLGVLYKKRGKVDRAFFEKIKKIVWKNCVLCGRCYCPIGVDIPGMIALARSVCRSQGVHPDFEDPQTPESWL